MVKPYSQVKEDEYNQVKQMQAWGIPGAKISTFTGRSGPTVHRMLRSNSFEHYREIQRQAANHPKYASQEGKKELKRNDTSSKLWQIKELVDRLLDLEA